VNIPVDTARPEQRWGVGAGINFKQKAYRGVNTDTTLIPLLTFENDWIRFAGPTVDLKLPAAGPLSLAVRARYAFDDGYEPGDAAVLGGMAERKSSLWLGAAAIWRNDVANIGLDWLADASNHSKGQRLRLTLEKPYRIGSFLHTPRLGFNWLDNKYVDYYYGVTQAEARIGRQAYKGKSALNTELGLRSVYLFSKEHSIYLDVSTTWLGSAIKDSPLVDRGNENALRLGYVYQFK
jgi:outer membrane scaffolding protein for murein synthesis (MipA/OmpV family)